MKPKELQKLMEEKLTLYKIPGILKRLFFELIFQEKHLYKTNFMRNSDFDASFITFENLVEKILRKT